MQKIFVSILNQAQINSSKRIIFTYPFTLKCKHP